MSYRIFENIVLKRWKSKNLLVAKSDIEDKRGASKETYSNKDSLKQAGFKWNTEIMSWVIDPKEFNSAKLAINRINGNNMISIIDDLLDFIEDSVDDKPSEKDALSNKVKAYMDKLIEDLENPEIQQEYLKYIRFKSKFYKYSFGNQLLIWVHNPEATYVASYRTWQTKFNRQVIKGAKGIPIFVPIIYNKKSADGDEVQDALTDHTVDDEMKKKQQRATSFKVGWVFDIADTEHIQGKEEIEVTELNWRGSNDPSEKSDKLFEKLSEFVEDYGVPVEKNPSGHGEDGWTNGKVISINSEASGDRKLRVLIHEFAHYILHFDGALFSDLYTELKEELQNAGKKIDLGVIRENHADGITYMVMTHFGFETKYNINYLLGWKSNRELIRLNEKILSAGAEFIIRGIGNE